MARQATVDSPTLKFFAASLADYPQSDIQEAIEALCHRKREPGETAFPDLGTIEDQIIYRRNLRRREERRQEEAIRKQEELAHICEHPECYVTLAEIWENAKWARAQRASEGDAAANPLASLVSAEHLTEEQKEALQAIVTGREAA